MWKHKILESKAGGGVENRSIGSCRCLHPFPFSLGPNLLDPTIWNSQHSRIKPIEAGALHVTQFDNLFFLNFCFWSIVWPENSWRFNVYVVTLNWACWPNFIFTFFLGSCSYVMSAVLFLDPPVGTISKDRNSTWLQSPDAPVDNDILPWGFNP